MFISTLVPKAVSKYDLSPDHRDKTRCQDTARTART